MPESITSRFTVAHAEVSARVPKRTTSAHTQRPMISEQRKQPRRNSARLSGTAAPRPERHAEQTGGGPAPPRPRTPPRPPPPPARPRADGEVADLRRGEEL